jgi:putative transcriptional regulator
VPPADLDEDNRVVCHLDDLLAEREMTLTELADRVGVSIVNLSIMKNNKAKAVRFTTLVAVCTALRCQVGDLFSIAAHDQSA